MSKKSEIADAKGLVRRHEKIGRLIEDLSDDIQVRSVHISNLNTEIDRLTPELRVNEVRSELVEADLDVKVAEEALAAAKARRDAIKARAVDAKEWRPSHEVVELCEEESRNRRGIRDLQARRANLLVEADKIKGDVSAAMALLRAHAESLKPTPPPEPVTVVVEQPFKAPRVPLGTVVVRAVPGRTAELRAKGNTIRGGQ